MLVCCHSEEALKYTLAREGMRFTGTFTGTQILIPTTFSPIHPEVRNSRHLPTKQIHGSNECLCCIQDGIQYLSLSLNSKQVVLPGV